MEGLFGGQEEEAQAQEPELDYTSLDTLDPGSASYIDPGKKGQTPTDDYAAAVGAGGPAPTKPAITGKAATDDYGARVAGAAPVEKAQPVTRSTGEKLVTDDYGAEVAGAGPVIKPTAPVIKAKKTGKPTEDYYEALDAGFAEIEAGGEPEGPTEDGTPDEAVEEGPAAPLVSPDTKPKKPKKPRRRKRRVGRQIYQGIDARRAGGRGRGAGRRGDSVIDNGTGGAPYNDALGG
jgi:hypothetical protein